VIQASARLTKERERGERKGEHGMDVLIVVLVIAGCIALMVFAPRVFVAILAGIFAMFVAFVKAVFTP
jgi:hypothetical protein